MPAAPFWPRSLTPVTETEPNSTLDRANSLALTWSQPPGVVDHSLVGAQGRIGAGNQPSPAVDWYSFTLDRAATVQLSAFAPQGVVLSLYNTDATSGDPSDPLGHRMVGQTQGAGVDGVTGLDRRLGPGTYDVAVSGLGNKYFNPFLADSGYAGTAGAYKLLLNATALPATSSGLPEVLGADVAPGPSPGAALDRSPFTVRLELSGALAAAEANNLNVLLVQTDLPPADQTNLVAWYSYSSDANELEVQLAQPLGPGSYQLSVAAQAGDGTPVLDAPYSYSFQVTGAEGNSPGVGPPETPGSALPLNLTPGALTQVAGSIGVNAADGFFNANDLNVYHFQLTGPGKQEFIAEAFAGRIGSTLDPALSLYERVGDQLQLVSWNDNTNNPALASVPIFPPTPLANDSVLYSGLEAGDYYLVVSAGGNVPTAAAEAPFDPNASLAPLLTQGAFTTGDYVLNVFTQPDSTPPQVLSVHEVTSGGPTDPPAAFTVQFSEPVNLQQTVYNAGQQTLSSAFIEDPNGGTYAVELQSYDAATNEATFVVPERLLPQGPAGTTYTLHLSGTDPTAAITDLAGNPLQGNDRSGGTTDYVHAFQVKSSGRPTSILEEPNSQAQPQDLHGLAPFELQDKVTVTGTLHTETADYYQFQVFQDRTYLITLKSTTGSDTLPQGAWLTLTDTTTGTQVYLLALGTPGSPASQVDSATGSTAVLASLQHGDTYVLSVANWGAGTGYQLGFGNNSGAEAPPPLTVGPAPAIRIRLASDVPAPTSAGPLALTPPPGLLAGLGTQALPGTPAGSLKGAASATPGDPGTASPLTTLPGGVPATFLVGLGAPTQGGARPGGPTAPVPDLFQQVFGQSQAFALGAEGLGQDLTLQVGLPPEGPSDFSKVAGPATAPGGAGLWSSVIQGLDGWWHPQPASLLLNSGPNGLSAPQVEDAETPPEETSGGGLPGGGRDVGSACPGEPHPPAAEAGLAFGEPRADVNSPPGFALALGAFFAASAAADWVGPVGRQRLPLSNGRRARG